MRFYSSILIIFSCTRYRSRESLVQHASSNFVIPVVWPYVTSKSTLSSAQFFVLSFQTGFSLLRPHIFRNLICAICLLYCCWFAFIINCLGNLWILLVPTRSTAASCYIIILAEVIIWTNNEWWMARKRVYSQIATLSQVCIVIMFVMESHLKKLFSCLRRRPTLIEKIVHFSVSILVLDSERMVSLHLKHKILCSWFVAHHSYMTISVGGVSVFLWTLCSKIGLGL